MNEGWELDGSAQLRFLVSKMITVVAVLFVLLDLFQELLQAYFHGKLSRSKIKPASRKGDTKTCGEDRKTIATHFEEHPEDKFRKDYPGYGYKGQLESVLQDFKQ